MIDNLKEILNPRSVAVIGASRKVESWGYRISKTLLENFKGDVYLVNPKADILLDQKVYACVTDIDAPIDLAVITLPTPIVPDAVKDCTSKHVKGIIIIAGGFGEESGHWGEESVSLEAGKKLEEEIVEAARKGGARIIGPNCLGIYNPSIGLNTWGDFQRPPEGPIAFISQSGNLVRIAFTLAEKMQLGFSYYISVGNEADLQCHEYIRYLRTDLNTKVIALYIEGLKDGREFLKEARETSKAKPIVALKVGGTKAGARAAASHTGALAGRDETYAAAFKQAGVIRVTDDNELFDVVEALVKLPPLGGNKIAILTEGGGHAAIAADVAERFGFEIPILSNETQRKLRGILNLHELSETKNPVDIPGLTWDPLVLAECCRVLLQGDEVNGIIIAGLFGTYTDQWKLKVELAKEEEETAYKISEMVKEHRKPLIMHSVAATEKLKPLEILRSHSVPVYSTISRATRAMAALRDYAAQRMRIQEEVEQKRVRARRAKVDEIIRVAATEGRLNLLETEAKEVLREYGIPVPEFGLAKNKEEAVRTAGEIGYPVAMKIVSPQILHKSDAGCVKLNLTDREQVENAFEEIVKNAKDCHEGAQIFGTIVSRFMPMGTEVIVGVTRDPQFGPVLMFGLGGIFVEVLKDVSFRVVPLEKTEAYEMIEEIRGYPVLRGVRGEKPRDIDAIADIIIKASQLALEYPEIKEMDLNPVLAYPDGVSVVDARIILNKN